KCEPGQRRGATEHLAAAQILDDSVLVGLRRVGPVVPTRHVPAVADLVGTIGSNVRPCFEEQHGPRAGFRKARGDDASRRTAADDNDVELQSFGQAASPSQHANSRTSICSEVPRVERSPGPPCGSGGLISSSRGGGGRERYENTSLPDQSVWVTARDWMICPEDARLSMSSSGGDHDR